MNGSIQEQWDEHVAWSNVADGLKRQRTRARTWVLVLTIVGAALQTLAATVSSHNLRLGAGLGGVVALALVPFITSYFLTADDTRKWLRARSISEGIKSEAFRFRASADPYAGADALDLLRKKVREIAGWGKDMATIRARVTFTPRSAPPPLAADDYLRSRILEQIDGFYRPKAKLNAELAAWFRLLQIVLSGLAAVLGAVATFMGKNASLGSWVAVLTTIGGSFAAHAAAGRYEFQATTYYATARQLADLAEDWGSGRPAPSPEWSQFVQACEEAISAENRGWMAKLDEKP